MESSENNQTVELSGEHVILKPMDPSKLPTFFAWVQDPDVFRYINAAPPKTLEDERAWFESVQKDASERPFSIYLKKEGKLIGNCSIHNVQKAEEVSLGIMLGEKEEWGKGYGTETMRLLAEYARDILKVKRVWLTVDIENAAGIRSYEKVGFHTCMRRKKERHLGGSTEEFVMEIRFTDET